MVLNGTTQVFVVDEINLDLQLDHLWIKKLVMLNQKGI